MTEPANLQECEAEDRRDRIQVEPADLAAGRATDSGKDGERHPTETDDELSKLMQVDAEQPESELLPDRTWVLDCDRLEGRRAGTHRNMSHVQVPGRWQTMSVWT